MSIYKYKRLVQIIKEAILTIVFLPFSLVFLRPKKIVLISERGNDARDNGLFIFIYFNRIKKDKNCYFVIDKKSPDIGNLSEFRNRVIYKGTLKHYLFFYSAKIRASTHIMGTAPDNSFYNTLNNKGLLPGKNVMLQHGITQNRVESLFFGKTKFDLFICGAYPEYKYVSKEFGYPQGIVKYTGFSRFDGLYDLKTNKTLLVMPTWRKYIKSKEEFLSSDYYLSWNSLLMSSDLISILNKYDLKLVFYLHHEFQKYANLFISKSSRIIIGKKECFDVQKLLKESILLITDYSSVYFDFAYMKKPIIYYPFDYLMFYNLHYKKGYFDLLDDGFGPVANSQSKLLCEINKICSNNFVLENCYLERIKSFFKLMDSNNCERIYNAMVQLR